MSTMTDAFAHVQHEKYYAIPTPAEYRAGEDPGVTPFVISASVAPYWNVVARKDAGNGTDYVVKFVARGQRNDVQEMADCLSRLSNGEAVVTFERRATPEIGSRMFNAGVMWAVIARPEMWDDDPEPLDWDEIGFIAASVPNERSAARLAMALFLLAPEGSLDEMGFGFSPFNPNDVVEGEYARWLVEQDLFVSGEGCGTRMNEQEDRAEYARRNFWYTFSG